MTTSHLTELAKFLNENQISMRPQDLENHNHDASSHPAKDPDIVVWPQSTNDVVNIMKYASPNHVPVTPVGSRTSLEGNSIPVNGGISLDLSRMNRVLKIYEKDLQVTVEPGIIGTKLNEYLASFRLYFPAFPASAHLATLGGMIANNAGGMYALKYGVVGDYVLQLEIVLADGEIINTGSRSVKSVAGYDLKRLFIGSEGTLGVITKATLRVIPLITHKLLLRVSFSNVENAVTATLDILNNNIRPAAVEFLDTSSVKYVNKFKKINWQEDPTLLIEFHRTSETDDKSLAEFVKAVVNQHQSTSFNFANTTDEIITTWKARSAVHPAIRAGIPGICIIHGDVGLPISKIPEYLRQVTKLSDEAKLQTVAFGHVADGNVHVWVMHGDGEKSHPKAYELSRKLVDLALDLNGTSTAEHGIGMGKKIYLAKEQVSSLPLMKSIKDLLDPSGTLNPGKIFN